MTKSPVSDRVIPLGPGLPAIPERLLLAHARGEVLFIVGSGVSRPTLPDFRDLVLKVYATLDPAVHTVISKVPSNAPNDYQLNHAGLNAGQSAEANRFVRRDYDVVLGLLERRMDDDPHANSRVRQEVRNHLFFKGLKAGSIHRSLIGLANRGAAVTIATTNFDLLLEDASRRKGEKIESYSLGGIPRPGKKEEFAGVLHIHGALNTESSKYSNLVLTDQDFGEFYLRRRVVPDFIYDAARLFNIVLVGYSANDPPMRYLLNAVAADGTRFNDLKERFTFVGAKVPADPIELADWRGRGITPIPYDSGNDHKSLIDALDRWRLLSAINGNQGRIKAEIKRIVRQKRAHTLDYKRDLFDHLIRRGNSFERTRITKLVAEQKPDIEWLNAIHDLISEDGTGGANES